MKDRGGGGDKSGGGGGDAEESSEALEREAGLVGGSLRGFLRVVAARLKSVPMKLRVKPKQIAQSANHASSLFEAYGHFKSGHGDNVKYSVHTRKHLVHAKAFFFAAPMYLRSMVLDTALFYVYERSVDKTSGVYGNILYSSRGDRSEEARQIVPLLALSSGLFGGAMHGYMATFWDNKYYSTLNFFYKHHERVRLDRLGAAASGGLCYASLFGGYEASKYALLYLLNLNETHEDMSRLEGFFCILVSGLFSGFLSERMMYYTSSFETVGLRKGLLSIPSLPRTSLRACLPGMSSSAIGFIAYEYTKDHFDIALQ
jgi:hypothetical protein